MPVTMSSIVWLVPVVAMLPVFGLVLWLRFAHDPIDAAMCALVASQGSGFLPSGLPAGRGSRHVDSPFTFQTGFSS
jgi:hypothetical protein